MAGRTLAPAVHPITTTDTAFAISASAIRLDPAQKKGEEALPNERPEHRLAWQHYDKVGEVGAIVASSAAILSQCELYVGFVDQTGADQRLVDADGKMVTEFPENLIRDAHDVMSRYVDEAGSQRGLIRAEAECFHVTGDAYMVGWMVDAKGKPTDSEADMVRERWVVVARQSLHVKEERYVLRLSRDTETKLPPSAIAYRMWRRHSQFADESTAWILRANEAILDLRIFALAQRSAARSSIPADIQIVAAEAQPRDPLPLGTGPGAGGGPGGPNTAGPIPQNAQAWANYIEKLIGDAVLEVLTDAQSGRAVVGPVLAVAKDYVQTGFNSISLHRNVDTGLEALVEQAAQRIVRSSDSAPEMLFGLGKSSRWIGAQIDDTEYRRYFKPLAMDIADSWTLELLWGGLIAKGYRMDEIRGLRILVNGKGVVADPDLSKNATDGLKLGAISWAAWRKANGFSDADAPTPEEQAAILAALAHSGSQGGRPGGNDQGTPPDGASPVQASAEPELTVEEMARRFRGILTPPAIQATASPRAANLGGALIAVERGARTRLEEACQAALDQAIGRAGSKLRNWTKGNRELAALLSGVTPLHVPAALGVRRCLTLATSKIPDDQQRRDEMFLAAILACLAANRRITQQAYVSTLAIVNEYRAGLDLASVSVPAEEISANIGAAEQVLRESMLDLAQRSVFDPIPAVTVGERTGLSIPSPIIRRTLAADGGAPMDPGIGPSRDAATGFLGAPTVDAITPSRISWTWDYGSAPRTAPFEEHQALDGIEFSGPDDDVLSGSIFGGGYWFPGDHAGCQCDWVPGYVGDGAPSDGSGDTSGDGEA